VAVTLEGWIGTTVADGGLNIRANVVDALRADVFLALTYDAADGCGAASPPPRCRATRLLPAMYEGGRPDGPAGGAGAAAAAAPRVRVSLSPSLDSAELLRRFVALPHWPRLLAAHNAPGSPVACTPAPASASASAPAAAAASGYECSGIYKGNSFLAPVLGDHGIHNLHQLHALSLALQLVARTERRRGWRYDRIVHTRLDLQWLRPHPPLHLLAASQAWAPSLTLTLTPTLTLTLTLSTLTLISLAYRHGFPRARTTTAASTTGTPCSTARRPRPRVGLVVARPEQPQP